MIEDAEEQGRLKPGCTIIEPTSGNTGIGLALGAAVKGYKCIIVMPEKMSDEKVATLKLLGATIIRTPTEAAHDSPEGLFLVAQRLNKEIPDSIILDQYESPGNPLAHYDGTGEEILHQLGGHVDMVVIGVGTGGSVTGISQKIKERCPDCKIIGVDPEGSILSVPETLNETDVTFYEVEGIGYDFIPNVLHRELVDKWIKTNDKTAFPMIRRLIREEGILSGASSGAALVGALEAAKDLKAGQKCVVILPDGIRNYMTKFVTDNWLEARHFKEINNEFNFWWWDYKVANISVNPVTSISSKTTCVEALNTIKTSGAERLAVLKDDGLVNFKCTFQSTISNEIFFFFVYRTLQGFLTLKHLMKKIGNQNYQLSEPVEKVIFKQFQRVKSDTVLGLVSRILEIDDFVAVVDGSDHCVGFLTQLNLFEFMAAGPKAVANGK